MTPDEIVKYLMKGGECKRKGQDYTVIYKDGKFMTKETGTLVGNMNGLIPIRKENEER